MSQKFEKLKKILKELFQLDHPDLDFGLYRIMHAKAAEVTAFLEKDLLPQVKAEFGQFKTADKAELQKELDKVVAGLNAAEVDPETSPKVKELRAKLANESVDITSLENDVYDHLLSFFGRYYSDGDFVSKRRYSKDGKYAIPYDGEEVKLYWANHDQYYIKTSEYLRDYAFRLKPDEDAKPMRVHFRLADVAEGEHGNVKAAAGNNRVFIFAATNPVFLEADELVCCFEYRPATLTDWPDDVRSGKTKPPAQKDLTAIAEARILAADGKGLTPWVAELAKPHVKADGEKADYNRLRAHLNRYVGRNTFDYFIHKDLGGFLRRELDFFIKNEVMMLDDIENESAPRVEQYLSKIKVIRRIAGKIITFLAQLENFQKALWLKKKFVVETQYCVALKNIPNEFLPTIVSNAAQWAEWESLHQLSKLKQDDDSFFVEKVNLKSPEFLKTNPSLMIDTRHFDADFTARLLEALGDLDAKTDGVLFHSENFQALSLMQAHYRERVKCVYIDPPYNTGNDGFSYKDSYQHSSWMTMFADRMAFAANLAETNAICMIHIDNIEQARLRTIAEQVLGANRFQTTIAWKNKYGPGAATRGIGDLHEHILVFSFDENASLSAPLDESAISAYSSHDSKFATRGGFVTQPLATKSKDPRPNLVYAINHNGDEIWPDKQWIWSQDRMLKAIKNDEIVFNKQSDGSYSVRFKQYLRDERGIMRRGKPLSLLLGPFNQDGTEEIEFLFGSRLFTFPKPSALGHKLINIEVDDWQGSRIVLDYFAGSGTTGHAVINLNREDGKRRKVILVEMADYFETVLLPRLKKVAFTPEWKDGQPKRLATAEEIERGPRVFKIVRLESYEDTLNNLELKRSPSQQSLLDSAEVRGADKLREQYLLQYMLKVETRESQSLLNVAAFTDPTAYSLVVKRPGSDESREVNVDLLETFNWLLGLTVEQIATPQVFSAKFDRDDEKRLQLKSRLKPDAAGPYWFRTVTGTMPDGRNTLVIWRKLTGKPEEDNLVLDEWFTKQGYSSKDSEFGQIYVNGGNNLENLKTPDDTWKVRLIEDDFQRLMFAGEGV
jgi:adenine-specific DNA-methyltransferase